MKLRLSIFALLGAMLFSTLVSPALADPTPVMDPALAAKLRATKRFMIMNKAQQRILKGRLAANPKKKLPKGFRLYKAHHNEAGVPAPARQSTGAESALKTPAPQVAGSPSFGANVRVNNPATDVFTDAAQSEGSVAANGNNMVMTFNDGDGFDRLPPSDQLMGFAYSSNGGTTWTDAGQFPLHPSFPKWEWTSDPVVTVNTTTGEFLFTGLVYTDGPPPPSGTGTTNGVAFVKGSFSGPVFTWGSPVLIISASNTNTFFDKQWVAVDPTNSNIYVSYTKFTLTGDEIDFTRSTNGGSLWSAPIKLSSAADDGYVQGSRVAVGPNNEIYCVWQAIGPTDKDFFKMRKSTTLGVSFATEVQAADYFANFGTGPPGFNRERGITYPGLAVDRTQGPDRGRVYLTWNESVNFYASDVAGGLGNISETEGQAVFGQNDAFASARTFSLGNTLRGTISDVTNDLDFYKFTATQGQTCVFYVDSVSAGLDMAFRLFCSDTTTRLALSSPGKGVGGLIVWTCPANGTYYIRPAAWDDNSDPGQHKYRIRTNFHSPVASDRARDARDVYVSSSSNGLTWPTSGTGAPVRVNEDAPWFDNWLPEVAVTGHSRVFCTWFDFRDSNPTRCGGETNLYLFRSDNTGTNWTNLGLITDATSNWTNVATNVAPNMGDYICLFADQNHVVPAWGDGRDGNPNMYTVSILTPTPTLASLASSRVDAGRVELDWLAAEYANHDVALERREGDAGWSALTQERIDAGGRVRFVDATVAAGRRYGYRLAFGDGSGAFTYSQEAEIDVPAGLTLALGSPQPNPAVNDLWLSITLPSAQPATLSLVDIAGRVVRTRDVGALGAGVHRVNLAAGQALPAGVYVAVLKQGDRTLTTRASIVK